VTTIDQTPVWANLVAHHRAIRDRHMRELFAADPERARRFSLRLGDILLDYSKNRITGETLRLLQDLARAADLGAWISRMFGGAAINTTEQRAVLHTALRHRGGAIMVDGADVTQTVKQNRERMRGFVESVRQGERRGHRGARLTDVLHIGIGGSDLGPRMAVEALGTSEPGPLRVHFVSGLDDAQFAAATAGLDPAGTLVVVASKSFTTLETSANADLARKWLRAALGDDRAVAHQLVAVTANTAAAHKWGLTDQQIFPMWNWVGGRYSLWSAIGLPVALALGADQFDALLDGARAMDQHFRDAPLEENIPVTLALLGIWYANFFGAETHAVLPYDWRLRLLPSWLQQLDMESNGKSVDRAGHAVTYTTAPIIWGGSGNDGQHAFYQLLHQGTRLVPADFIAAATGGEPAGAPLRDHLVANFLAQTEALMKGRDEREARAELAAAGVSGTAMDELVPHKLVPGNRPTNSILVKRMDAFTLGALLAMYEHKVFVQGVIWNINSFDQFGVELGKTLADRITPELASNVAPQDHDASTNALITAYRSWRRPS
jgi:glucose-6-phosphate isomerase